MASAAGLSAAEHTSAVFRSGWGLKMNSRGVSWGRLWCDAARCLLGSAMMLYRCGSVSLGDGRGAVQMRLGVAWGRLWYCADATRCRLGSAAVPYRCGSLYG